MTKIRFFYLLILLLVVINLWQLFAGMMANRRENRPEPKEMIISRLKLDENQIVSYEKLIRDHRSKIQSREVLLLQAKKNFYYTLKNPKLKETEVEDKLIQINLVQKEIERIHYDHFLQIRALCKENQQLLFDELTKDLPQLFHPKPSKRRK